MDIVDFHGKIGKTGNPSLMEFTFRQLNVKGTSSFYVFVKDNEDQVQRLWTHPNGLPVICGTQACLQSLFIKRYLAAYLHP